METFPSFCPTYGASKRSQPKVRIAQFGSGYSQRTTFGINQNPKQWDLTFDVSEAESDTIEAFLDARGGVEAFEWTPPDETTEYKWTCSQWDKKITHSDRVLINTTFQQVFEA